MNKINKKCRFYFLHPILNYLDYKCDHEKCNLIISKINEAIYIRFFVKIYIWLIYFLSFIPGFIKINKNIILFKFVAGVVILIFESNTTFNTKSVPSKKIDSSRIYDTVVVGSGPGGAIAALRCVEKGEKVLIVESGSSFKPESIEHHSLEQTTKQFNQQGMSFCLGNSPMLYAEGSTYGGGSEVNSGLYFKLSGPHREKFLEKAGISEDEWVKKESEVENIINVQSSPKNTYRELNSALIRGSNKLELTVEEIPRWRVFKPKVEHQSMQVTYLKQAEKLGLENITDTEIYKINNQKEVLVLLGKSKNGDRKDLIEIRTHKIVLSAGTVNTPKLLKKSNLLSDKVRFNFHPMTRCVVDYGEDINDGDLFPPYQSWTKDYKYKFGYSVSSFPFVRATLASLGEFNKIPKLSNLVCYFSSTVLEESKGRILFFRDKAIPIIYITKNDRKKIKKGFELLKEIMTAAKVKKIWPKKANPSLTSVHIFGSLPINKCKDLGKYGELLRNPNIKISDSSLLPVAPWGNPQAVMMVLNEILIDKWLKSLESS